MAALIWAKRPELKNYQVAGIIKQSARRDGAGWTPTMGCGVLDAGAALELATSYSGAGRADGSCSTAGDPPADPDRAGYEADRLRASGVGEVGRPAQRSGSGWARIRIGLRRRSTCKGTARPSSASPAACSASSPGQAYGLAWRAPRVRKKGVYRFCVTLTGLSGKASAPSCAPISLR